jgi:hypothetical protein
MWWRRRRRARWTTSLKRHEVADAGGYLLHAILFGKLFKGCTV